MAVKSTNPLIQCKVPRWLGPAVRRQSPAARPLWHRGSWLWDVLQTDNTEKLMNKNPPMWSSTLLCGGINVVFFNRSF